MAHFAELDDNNIVIRVIVVDDENEHDGENWCHNFAGGRWKQTSYNNKMRYNYAGIGYIFDELADAFYAPRPYASWSLDRSAYIWRAPKARPDDGKIYVWDEYTLTWTSAE